MVTAKHIKKLREEVGLMQKEIANAAGLRPSNYSRMEKSEREFGIEVIDKLAKFFRLTIIELVHPYTKSPKEVKVEDETANVKIQLISQLNEEEKAIVYYIIDRMLTKNKFQTFYKQNIHTAK